MIGTGQRGRNMAIGTKLVAGNWKMNGLRQDGATLAHALKERAVAAGGTLGCEILVCPPATLLSEVGGILAGSGIASGAKVMGKPMPLFAARLPAPGERVWWRSCASAKRSASVKPARQSRSSRLSSPARSRK